jgi:hypothetical protein
MFCIKLGEDLGLLEFLGALVQTGSLTSGKCCSRRRSEKCRCLLLFRPIFGCEKMLAASFGLDHEMNGLSRHDAGTLATNS